MLGATRGSGSSTLYEFLQEQAKLNVLSLET